ncbi:ubiquitin-conjugating enzyme/RWD-like protein [Syncephalis fuscata]|nr:ubiquitin-conjugating enzyme/RWD-like protein [Syncephalis fuscata]
MFEFLMEFPRQYPSVPPVVRIITTDGGQTRFNPNLYADGKVCLSILGTWTGSAGEQWSSAHGVSSVLLSIQSIMSETPTGGNLKSKTSTEKHTQGLDLMEAEPSTSSTSMASNGDAINSKYTAEVAPASMTMVTSDDTMDSKDVVETKSESIETTIADNDLVDFKNVESIELPSTTTMLVDNDNEVINSKDTASINATICISPVSVQPSSSHSSIANDAASNSMDTTENESSNEMNTTDKTKATETNEAAQIYNNRMRLINYYYYESVGDWYENIINYREAFEALLSIREEQYKCKTMHETIRISVCDRLETLLNIRKKQHTSINCEVLKRIPSDMPFNVKVTTIMPYIYQSDIYTDDFADISKRLFLWHFNAYLAICEAESRLIEDRSPFQMMPFESKHNGMSGIFNYSQLVERLLNIKRILLKEQCTWEEQSKEWIKDECGTGDNLRGQLQQIINSNSLEGMELSLEDDNPYIWNVSIFGKPMTNYDGGFFQLKLVFHKDFPEVWPRAVFRTPVYHCHVTEDGIPYYRVKREKDLKEHLQQIAALFAEDPSPNPATHVNTKAAALYFGTADERRQYARSARRCAARSVEYE